MRATQRSLIAFAAASLSMSTFGLAADAENASPASETTIARGVVPDTVPFQGYLTDDLGDPIDGTVDLNLAIYDVPGGGTALWTESLLSVPVTVGLFKVDLGSPTPFPTLLFDGRPLYLGISVDGDPELPRTQLQSTPFAKLSNLAVDAIGKENGFTEIVNSETNVNIREYFLDDTTEPWAGNGNLILSFNGDSQGGNGTCTISGGGAEVVIDIISGGGRPWTYLVPRDLGVSNAIDVKVRADDADFPVLVRSITLETDNDNGVLMGNTLDEAYDQGGAGAGRTIIADAGPVVIQDDGLEYADAAGVLLVEIEEFAGAGGEVLIYEDTGASFHTRMQPDNSGEGGFFSVSGGVGTGFQVDGNSGSDNSARITMSGANSTTLFDTNLTGSGSVTLPADAVSATEILDEPGMTQAKVNNVSLVLGDMLDVATTSITIPTTGYIVLYASAQARIPGTGAQQIAYQIDETAGGTTDNDYYHFAGFNVDAPSGTSYIPIAVQRTYFKTAGTYTFRLEARQQFGSGAGMWNSTLTAVFIPTSYGTVSTIVGHDEGGEFSEAREVTMGDNGLGVQPSNGVEVDLRELELRAIRAQAALDAARIEAAKAGAEEQLSAGN